MINILTREERQRAWNGGLDESLNKGMIKGVIKGRQEERNRLNSLYQWFLKSGRVEDALKAIESAGEFKRPI